MKRIPEPELMDDPAQALAYAEADFSEPHEDFVLHFRERFPRFRAGRVLDLGCGPADVTLRFAAAFPEVHILGVDGSPAMLRLGRRAILRAGLQDRVRLQRKYLPCKLSANFDALISNSLLHHLAHPVTLWDTILQCSKSGTAVFIMDLLRPASLGEARHLVDAYAGDAPEVLRRDFLNSLRAAYRPEETWRQLQIAGLTKLRIETISDRHWIAWGRI
jgi:ubiquinone/menaquinone biosynthesis C-methylase UbiE